MSPYHSESRPCRSKEKMTDLWSPDRSGYPWERDWFRWGIYEKWAFSRRTCPRRDGQICPVSTPCDDTGERARYAIYISPDGQCPWGIGHPWRRSYRRQESPSPRRYAHRGHPSSEDRETRYRDTSPREKWDRFLFDPWARAGETRAPHRRSRRSQYTHAGSSWKWKDDAREGTCWYPPQYGNRRTDRTFEDILRRWTPLERYADRDWETISHHTPYSEWGLDHRWRSRLSTRRDITGT